jgi:hypothetical protein
LVEWVNDWLLFNAKWPIDRVSEWLIVV